MTNCTPSDTSDPAAEGHWLKQTLQPNSLRFLTCYMAIQFAVILLTSVAFPSQYAWLLDRVYWVLLPAQAVLTLITLFFARRHPGGGSVGAYLLLLLGSIALLVWYLYGAGGHTNPVISLLLVPLAMSAALLGWQATSIVALMVLLCYTLLTQLFVPLEPNHYNGQEQHFMQLHLTGMWLTFLVSVLLILGLILPLALTSRAQQQRIAQQQEKMLRNEKIIAMATFAAGTAHKLGTPLSTVAILLEDLQESFADRKEFSSDVTNDLNTMKQQIQICKTILRDMMRRADKLRNNTRSPLPVADLINELRQQFSLLHPARQLNILTAPLPHVVIEGDETLELALLNLLDNAVQESQADPQLQLRLHDDRLCIRIIDTGPGIPEIVRQQLGKPFNTGRTDGLGLGLFLSHTTINRLGGALQLIPAESGAVIDVWLPLLLGESST